MSVSFESSMQQHFASILMELTMQYAELTDAHIFLLMESQDAARKFAGKQHLKEMYLKGELKPCGKDAEIVVDPDLTQLYEVSRDEDEESNSNPEKNTNGVENRPRRHIGELPSERRERMRKEKKTYYKFVSMSNSVECSFGTFLMEALVKFSCLSDVDVFFLIETNRSRRFAGRSHLCDQYLKGELCPTGMDVEIDLDTSVKVVVEKRVPRPETDSAGEKIKEQEKEQEKDREAEDSSNTAEEMETTSAKPEDPVALPTKRKHSGELPSERRARAIREGRLRARFPPKSSDSVNSPSDEGRKHKGELPSERKERLKREREAKERAAMGYGEGPGFIYGPSPFSPGLAPGRSGPFNHLSSSVGWTSTGSDSYAPSLSEGFGSRYSDNQTGADSYKSGYSHWKSGGTMSAQGHSSRYGW